MRKPIFWGMIALTAVGNAQALSRTATIVGGGNRNGGKCTVEVVVDGVAEVEIHGSNATLRNLGGASPQWRRFECTSPLPANPGNFRFSGVDGRGRQELVRDPRNGGAAVVRIEDPDSGSEGYTFDLTWGTNVITQDRGPIGGRDDRNYYPDHRQVDVDAYHRDRDAWLRGNDWRSGLFRRIREDLDHVTSGTFPFTGDRARLARTETELDELQSKLSQGFYDEQELDEVIGAMQVVISANRLTPRDRVILTDDISRMRDFRIRHDQYGARDIEGPYHRQRDQRFSGNDWRQRFFEQIREDLDHVASTTFPFGGDQARLSRTKFELDELQEKLSRGFYDEQELDEVIGALEVVLQSNRLGSRDGGILSDDLSRMRDFRIRHDQYGAR
jgi:hypothetical protein